MALQDVAADAPNLIDPATGQPYLPGSPEYAAAIGPWLTGQVGKEAQRAANARGMFYSGPAMADEVQARTGALTQLAQQGAAQSLQEKELAQQEAFQAQMAREQNQANADAARAMGKGQMMGGAINGGTGALGSLAGMYAANKFGLFGSGHGATGLADQMSGYNAAVKAGYSPTQAAKMAGLNDVPGAAGGAPGSISEAVSASNAAPIADMGGAGFEGGVGGNVTPLSDFGGAEAGSGTGIGDAMLAPGMPGVGGALAALPGAWYGSQAGQRQFGDSNAAKAGSAAGGGVGLVGGSLLGGPLGGMAGAAAGSYLGADIGTHPGDLVMPINMIPGVRGALSPVGNAFNSAAKDVGNFFGGLF